MSRISLDTRLQTLEETGCSDPTVLPKILQSWGSAPAYGFFPEGKQWEQMQRILSLDPDDGAVITYRQMSRAIQELCEAPFPGGSGSGMFVDAIALLGRAFADCRPASAPASNQRLPLSERLKAPDSHLKRRILALRTQAMALAVDGMTGGKPMDFSRFIHENTAVHYVPEDEGKIQTGEALHLAGELEAAAAACIRHYLLVLPFTMI